MARSNAVLQDVRDVLEQRVQLAPGFRQLQAELLVQLGRREGLGDRSGPVVEGLEVLGGEVGSLAQEGCSVRR